MDQVRNKEEVEYLSLGDSIIVIQFEKKVTIEHNSKVLNAAAHINSSRIPGIVQVVPTFCSIAIRYNPMILRFKDIKHKLQGLLGQQLERDQGESKLTGKTIHIPVVYGGEYGPDLPFVAEQTGLDEGEVVRIHASQPYLIFMVGFIDGVPYCGEIDSRLSLPRRETPRLKVEKGSVLIANLQTIIFPIASPGGWHIIGRTPMETFNPLEDPPILYLAGDYLKFEPITSEEAEGWNANKQSEWNEKWNLSKS